MDNRVYDIWLSLACTAGSETFSKLAEKFSDSRSIYSADESEIVAAVGSRCKDILSLSDKNLDKANGIFDYCISKNIGTVAYYDSDFPDSLRKILAPPVLLYYRGKLPDFSKEVCFAVVGTRRLSEYGLKNAFRISADLAIAGATVVSGMAIGIDGVAHAGALSVGAKTVAVLGSGIDVCYPDVHKNLARAIVADGCVMTEYAPGSKPERQHFPARNRIISGLSRATIVVEGKERSGALLTARHSTKQGKPVYALPGNIGNPNSQLPNLLLKNGARLCTAADDVIRDFQDESLGKLNPFLLTDVKNTDPYEFLEKYSVSAVTDNDKVFKRSYPKNPKKPVAVPENQGFQEIEFDDYNFAQRKKLPEDNVFSGSPTFRYYGNHPAIKKVDFENKKTKTEAELLEEFLEEYKYEETYNDESLNNPAVTRIDFSEDQEPKKPQQTQVEDRSARRFFRDPENHPAVQRVQTSFCDIRYVPKETLDKAFEGIDCDVMDVYKRIPHGKEVPIESLVTAEWPLRKVMKCLLALEIAKYVTMLPGERCKRNF